MNALKTTTIAALAGLLCSCSSKIMDDQQYFFLNDSWNSFNYETIHETFGDQKDERLYVGNAILIYLLAQPIEEVETALAEHFRLSEKYNIPVLVELDPITFWDGVPELWNWWDPDAPGYNPDNRENVEWNGWTSDKAVKIGWLNWGRQIRLKPMANLFSPAYLAVVKERTQRLVDLTARWYESLPKDRKYLLGGIKIIGELGLGFNNWYYPDGNSYYDKPESADPTGGVDIFTMPDRGVGTMIGYAALTYSGIKTEGEITPEDIFLLEKKYSALISEMSAGRGIGRERLFSHGGGAGEDMNSCIHPEVCPSWSFYFKDALHPSRADAMVYLANSDAPYWGLSEWSIWDNPDETVWREALDEAFSIPRCRFVSLFNYSTLFNMEKPEVRTAGINAIRELQKKYRENNTK